MSKAVMKVRKFVKEILVTLIPLPPSPQTKKKKNSLKSALYRIEKVGELKNKQVI